MNGLLLWIAQGFGTGRIALAPGTFGSMVGLLWFALLLLTKNLWLFLGGTAAGVALSVWVCHVGEKVLGKKDPGSIVFDELAAIPLCYAAWVIIVFCRTGSMPAPELFISKGIWPLTLAVFVAFRFFDVLKPWPVRQSQSFHGGLGVTLDDVLAALYVNVLVVFSYGGSMLLP